MAQRMKRVYLNPLENINGLSPVVLTGLRYVMAKKLPASVLAYFREQGARGGRIGGRRALETMTREERVARATKASRAAAVARKRKVKKTKTK
jgi:hypothetical protein